MEKVLNSDRENPEIIATFLDHTLQGKGVKEKLNDAAISSTVEETLGLIRYVVVSNWDVDGVCCAACLLACFNPSLCCPSR